MKQFDDKVMLITGIGRAAQLFTEAGAFVFGVDCNSKVGEALATNSLPKNLTFEFLNADFQQNKQLEKYYFNVVKPKTYKRIDILYNNAGFSVV